MSSTQLHLIVTSEEFEAIINGEKKLISRESNNLSKVSLMDFNHSFKKFSSVKISKNWSERENYIIVEHLFTETAINSFNHEYSNGLISRIMKGNFLINIGEIKEYRNIPNCFLQQTDIHSITTY